MSATNTPVIFPSSLLPQVSDILDKFEGLRQVLGPVFRPSLILDTSCILADFRFVVRHQRNKNAEPDLLEVLKSRVASIIAPSSLEQEVRSHFVEFAEEHRVPVKTLEDLWEKYRPHITFCPDSALPPVLDPDSRRLEKRDPTDVKFPAAFAAVGAHAILTKDADYEATRLPVAGVTVVLDLRNHARHKTVELHLLLGGFFVSSIAFAGVWGAIKAVQAIVNGIARMPAFVQLLLAAGGLALVFSPRARAWALGWAEPFLPVIREYAQLAMDHIQFSMTEGGKAKLLADETEKRLVAAIPLKPRTLRQAVIATLVEARRPLGEAEIAGTVVKRGYRTKSSQFGAYLRRVLRNDPRLRLTRGETGLLWALSA